VLNSSGTVLATLHTYSNLDHNTGYAQRTFSLAPYAGQAITLKFTGAEDCEYQTSCDRRHFPERELGSCNRRHLPFGRMDLIIRTEGGSTRTAYGKPPSLARTMLSRSAMVRLSCRCSNG